ncbi:general odorant-binding protein 71 isoform X2 [Ceratina calcarata]|uniref:General odorant-binding protein 71 isoform X2 n=1 Tax=Ceratina calcarata TaxID=156304 RepID=A0AAJ7WC61_9HYME|nr:general odorant-binding protein 71 isoform X2 [Ceratina calcarata]
MLFVQCYEISFPGYERSLRCRSGNQQMDAHFQKVLRTCRSRYAGSNSDNGEDSMSMDESSSSDSNSGSEENVYEKNFYYKKDDNRSYNQSMNNQRDGRNADKNGNTNTRSSDHSINGNVRDSQNMRNNHKTNDRDSWNSRDTRINNGNTRFNNSADREQGCVVQCFFSELHAVDQKGFPDKDLVIPLMSQNIQDPELKDFIEGSISECFRYMEFKKQEKCEFSQSLLTCLAEKGQQNCEDWEN